MFVAGGGSMGAPEDAVRGHQLPMIQLSLAHPEFEADEVYQDGRSAFASRC